MLELRKEFFADERKDDLHEVGKPTQRQDALGHVTGRSPFYADHLYEGMLHIRCVRSPYHHARIRRIDISEAERSPGVVRVMLGRDVPQNLNTLLSLLDFGVDDEPLLSETKVAYQGEPVAAIVAETERAAREAVAKVRVDWEELPAVFDVEAAIAPGAPVVNEVYPGNKFVYHGKYDHQKLRFGDVEAAFARADRIVKGRYQMAPIEHAPTETGGAIAVPESNGRFTVHTSTQAIFFSLDTTAKLLAMPNNRLHFIGGTVGGGFGGKIDSIHEPLAVLGCMLTGRPCKSQWDREEEMQVGAPRGAERWYVTDGVMNDGRIIARKLIGYFDVGAYTRLSSYAIIKAIGHIPGPYTFPNVYADTYCVFTNRTPSTAMRGFGVTAVDFAMESNMDKVATELGMDPIELRLINAYRDGDMKPHRRIAGNTAIVECCQVAAEKAGWALPAAAKQDSSLTGGGGVRGQLPAHTALDQNGAVSGYAQTSYGHSRRKRPSSDSRTAAALNQMPAPSVPPPDPGHRQRPAAPAPAPAPAHGDGWERPAPAPAHGGGWERPAPALQPAGWEQRPAAAQPGWERPAAPPPAPARERPAAPPAPAPASSPALTPAAPSGDRRSRFSSISGLRRR